MKILSLFDGISIAQQAFKELGFEVEYYASEIDKYAIQITQKNHPNTEQLGDIKNIDCTNGLLHYGKGKLAETDIYLIIGGSPCQDLSIAKKDRKGLNGERSGLFWEYVRILKELKPKYFVLENVASMSKESRKTITETLFDIEPVMINASLVSAQNRKRLFWVGELADKRHIGHWNDADYVKVNVSQPEDKEIYLKDILESGDIEKMKSHTIDVNYFKGGKIGGTHQSSKRNYTIRVGQFNSGGQGDRVYSPDGKSVSLSALGGGRGAKTGLYCVGLIPESIKPKGNYLPRERVFSDEGKFRAVSTVSNQQPWVKTVALRNRGHGKKPEVGGDKANSMTTVQTDSMVAFDYYNDKFVPNNKAKTLGTNPQCTTAIAGQLLTDGFTIRKLTPIECERLQSLPDNYTEGISNTQRYKTLGNGFNCAVIKHILTNLLNKECLK